MAAWAAATMDLSTLTSGAVRDDGREWPGCCLWSDLGRSLSPAAVSEADAATSKHPHCWSAQDADLVCSSSWDSDVRHNLSELDWACVAFLRMLVVTADLPVHGQKVPVHFACSWARAVEKMRCDLGLQDWFQDELI